MDVIEACEILGVNADGDLEEIKRIYLAKIRIMHPDVNEDKEKANRDSKMVNCAYDTICEYRSQPATSEELFNSIFDAFDRVIREHHGVVSEVDNGFVVHINLDEDPIWRNEEEYWTV
jgi:DnaJ-class molecular chaperone